MQRSAAAAAIKMEAKDECDDEADGPQDSEAESIGKRLDLEHRSVSGAAVAD